MKMLKEDMLASIIKTNVQTGVPFHDTSRESSSPFISHLINSCLLYTRGDHTAAGVLSYL